MRITISKVRIHNFLSFSDEEFDFNSYKGMNRIKGKNLDIPNQLNGCGKSALMNSLVYGLFGELPFKLKIENINNRYIKDRNTKVSVEFKVSDNEFMVVSGLRGKQSYCELYSMGEDGEYEDITHSTIAETRKYIEKDILHCDMNLFMRTIYLNSDPDYNFYNLKHADRKEFIDKLFDISIFGDMYNAIHRDVLRLEKDINAHQNRLIILNRNSDDFSVKSDEFEKRAKDTLSTLEGRLENVKSVFDRKKSTSVKKNSEIEDRCTSSIKKIEDTISKLKDKKNSILKDRSSITQSVRMYTSMIGDRQKIIDKHSEILGKLCDDCRPVFSKHYNLDKYQSEIQSLANKISAEKDKDARLSENTATCDSKISECNSRVETLKNTLEEATSTYNMEQNEIKNLEREIISIESQISGIKEQKNPYSVLISENDGNIRKENETLEKLNEEYKYTRKSQDIVDQENLKKFIIHDMVGLLNEKIKFYLHKLGSNYDIVFDDDMKYDFITSAKSGVEFNNFSKGEQARISIATCFAFREFLSTRSRITSNVLILDEFFDSNVDPAAIENTMDILKTFVRNNKQKIFVVSHRLEVSDDSFNNIINIEKKNNISHIK